MATIDAKSPKKNILLHGLSGKIFGLVFRNVRGKTIISKCPRKRSTNTVHQEMTKIKFLRATHYAKTQLRNPLAAEEYRSGINDRKNSAYLVAVTDYLTPPRIHAVDTRRYRGIKGDMIDIWATDDFKVESVDVEITSPAGTLIEKGPAWLDGPGFHLWRYQAKKSYPALSGTKITVTVRDKPGNEATMEKFVK